MMGGGAKALGLSLGLASAASALTGLQVENAVVGGRTLVITVDDSIRAPDLSKIQVEGYSVENAVFIEESGDSIRVSPSLIDLTEPGRGRVLDFAPDAGLLILDASPDFLPQPGTLIADTAFGGLLRKVVSLEGSPQSVPSGMRWTLRTVEAGLTEAVLDCDISFRTRVDMNLSIADTRNAEEVVGSLEDGSPAYGQVDYAITGGRVLFQPWVSGRIRIAQGRVASLDFQVQGDCEIAGNMHGGVTGTGEFELEDELPSKAPLMIPLGHGLFVKARNRPFARVEALSRSDGFSARADFRVVNTLRGQLGYDAGQWRPLADNRSVFEGGKVQELWGDGQMRLLVKPRVEFLLDGMHGPAFTFEPYARFASTGTDHARTFSTGSGQTVDLTSANKELTLGANIYMETRTTFLGPALSRNFLLFNREQTVFSPPKEGSLTVKESDSGRVFLNCETFPKADFYAVQQRIGAGPWETVLENVPGPRIRLGNLKPASQYRFRVLGMNAMGRGPAFPPEGIGYVTPAANRPPFAPMARLTDSGVVLTDSLAVLSWRGGDPDPGAHVLYTVYLDVKNPPEAVSAAGIADSSLALPGLKPGTTYFWKVAASDGSDRSEGLVHSFTTRIPEPAKPSAWPAALIPKGTYRRQDGKIVKVGPFLMGKYEVTQVEFEKVMGRNPSYRLHDSLPVERVTWEEAANFCRETGGRLPTEAEWEYAARGGITSGYYWGRRDPGDYAWYRGNSDNRTQKVGLKKPNSWGLYDMAGNVFEWAQDWFGEYSPDDLDHPKGPSSGTAKVIRGASWYSEAENLNLSARYNNRPGFRNFKVGFRCAKDVESLSEAQPPSPSLAAKTPAPVTPAEAPVTPPPAP